MRSTNAQADKPTKTGPVTPKLSILKFSSAASWSPSQMHLKRWLLNFSTHQVNTEASNDVSGVSCDVLLFCFSTTASI